MAPLRLIVALGISLALVVALALSLLTGTGSESTKRAQGAPAGATQDEFFGIVQGIRLDAQDFQTMAETGVRSDRFLLIWSSVEPSQGSFNWAPTDLLVGDFAAHGIRAIPSVWGSPTWATGSQSTPPVGGASEQAWRNFLQAAVARYGPGGSYWTTNYRRRYGPDAKPLPIQSWQVWNEPNLKKYFAPAPSPTKYARLLQVSHDAIKSKDPNARIVLAGMPGYGEVDAWDYLDRLYAVPGITSRFDAVSLHPYAPNLDQLRLEIQRVREVMKKHSDGATPLWISEIGWGSAPPDRFGLNKGIKGQEKMLAGAFKLIVSNRTAWNVQRLFWFDWRDPSTAEQTKCSFCASAGLLKFNRDPKPAYYAFKRFAGAH